MTKNSLVITFLTLLCSACSSAKTELIKPEGEWHQINLNRAEVSPATATTPQPAGLKK